MKVLIVCASKYGSTHQIGRWMRERYLHEGCITDLIDAAEQAAIVDYELIVMGSGIYSHKILPSLKDFIDGNLEALKAKRTALFGVLMKTSPVFYKGSIHGGLEHLRPHIELLRESIIHADMLHGEIVPSRLSPEDREAMMRFYRLINLSEPDIRERLRPRTMMDKREAWDFVEKTFKIQ